MALPFAAYAQTKFPERPIKLIVPWGAGGPADAGLTYEEESELLRRLNLLPV
jgi:hypothetical protein